MNVLPECTGRSPSYLVTSLITIILRLTTDEVHGSITREKLDIIMPVYDDIIMAFRLYKNHYY